MSGRVIKWLACAQGLYYFATGLWPLVDIESFQAVTGPKADLWLVRTVGLLVMAIGGALLIAARRGTITPETLFLAIASALALAGIDLFYALTDVIRDIYLADAVAELVLVAAWVWRWATHKGTPART